MNQGIELDEKNLMTMKLLHYFITERNYNPIILQGVENEIWLENLNADYEIIRIVSGHIHNDEQYGFDVFKTKRIVKKIKRKTFSFDMNVFSFFLDVGEDVKLKNDKNFEGVIISSENDMDKNKTLNSIFPDLKKKTEYKENGFELFMKITNDINSHNQEDSKKVEDVFKIKTPYITYIIIALCCAFYIVPLLMGFDKFNYLIENFSVNGKAIRSGEYYRLLTGTFLHGNLLHLFCNCYSLKVIGTEIESYLGRKRFLLVYLISALFGSLLSIVFNVDVYSIGASGAIFGLLGALLYFGYHYRVFLGNYIKTQLLPFIILYIIIGFGLSGIDNFAHIGGLIGGILATKSLGVQNKSTKSEMINGWVMTGMFLVFLIYLGFVYVA